MAMAAMAIARTQPRRRTGCLASICVRTESSTSEGCTRFEEAFTLIILQRNGRTSPQYAVHNWHKEQSENGCDQKSANDSATQRGILFAAFAEAQRHRKHANDHCEGGHEHRSK